MFSTPYIVYKTTNLLNGMVYVGVHIQKDIEFDGYFGSNKHLRRSIKKHGKHNFKRETLISNLSKEEAYEVENLLVDAKFISRKDVYNEKCGGCGGSNKGREFHLSEEYRESRRKSMQSYSYSLKESGKDHPNKGRKHSQETLEKFANRKPKSGSEHHFYGISKEDHPKGMLGKTHDERTKLEISEKLIEHYKHNKKTPTTDEVKLKISEANKGKPAWNAGKKVTDSAILQKMRQPRKQKTCPHCATVGAGGNMSRYHFDNCKEIKNV